MSISPDPDEFIETLALVALILPDLKSELPDVLAEKSLPSVSKLPSIVKSPLPDEDTSFRNCLNLIQ